MLGKGELKEDPLDQVECYYDFLINFCKVKEVQYMHSAPTSAYLFANG